MVSMLKALQLKRKVFKVKQIITVGALFLILILGSQAQAQEVNAYRSEKGHFTFTVPDGWEQTSEEKVRQREAAIEEQLQKKLSVETISAFKKNGAVDFRPPYIMVRMFSHDGALNKKRFEKKYALKSEKVALRGFAGEAVRGGLARNLNFNKPLYDETSGTVLTRGRMTIDQVGELDNVQAVILGEKAMIIIAFGSFTQNYNEDVAAFEKILAPFKFNEGYEYQEQEKGGAASHRDRTFPWWQRDLMKVMAWVLIIFVVYTVIFISNWIQKKRSGR